MDTKYCPECELPMFIYKLKHNGKDKVVYKCMLVHKKMTMGRKVAKGKYKHFRSFMWDKTTDKRKHREAT